MSEMSFAQKSRRLSPMYFFFFSLFGIFVPYVARYLTDSGLTEQQASIIVAVFFGVNMFAPFIFSYLADRSGRRLVFLRISYFLMGVFYLVSYFGAGFWFYLIVFGLFGTFLSAALPQMESITLSILGKQKSRYGQIRLWGSLGFVAIVWAIGYLIDIYTVRILPLLGVGAISLLFLVTFLIPERPRKTDQEKNEASHFDRLFSINWPQVFVLLGVILLWQFGMAPYNTFFDLYLRNNGFSATTIGFLISFGTLTEIGIFIYVSTLLGKYSHRALMTFALVVTIARWLILYIWPQYFAIVLLSQSAHAATFGLVHAVSVHRIALLFPETKASFGQGLYVAVGTGAGLFIGNLIAGYFWNGSGQVYLVGAAWVCIALLLTWFGFKEDKQTT